MPSAIAGSFNLARTTIAPKIKPAFSKLPKHAFWIKRFLFAAVSLVLPSYAKASIAIDVSTPVRWTNTPLPAGTTRKFI